jgi:hypothetical protein
MTTISKRLRDDRRIVRIAGKDDAGGYGEVAITPRGEVMVVLTDVTVSEGYSFWTKKRHFFPFGGTVAAPFSDISARIEFPPPAAYMEALKIHNPSDFLAFVRLGDAEVVAQIPDYPVLPHSEAMLWRSIDIGQPHTHLAVIAQAGAGTIYCTLGAGG